jgi:hypothetical protein
MYKKRYGDLFTSVRAYPSAKALKCNSVTDEGINKRMRFSGLSIGCLHR